MGIQFDIQYEENPHGMFFTGQMVRGSAIVKLDEPISVKAVRLRVRGYAAVRWEESISVTNSDGTTTTTSDTHSDQIDYFDSITECVDTKESDINLEPGVHTYTFACLLPENCPSSFKGLYGRFQYETKITLVRTWKLNKSYTKAFNVHKIVDLNHSPMLRIPSNMEVIKTFCCWPCSSNPLIVLIDIPQTGYAPGEFMNIRAKCVNNSGTKVEQLRIALNLIAFHKVRSRVSTKTQKITIAKNKHNVNGQKVFEIRDRIRVPPTPPSCENLCEILKITYELEVIAKVKGAHRPAVVTIPVTIGSIPLVATTTDISEDALIANLRNDIMLGQRPISDAELLPPSYEEAVYMTASAPQKDDENTYCENYLPRYPVYGAHFPYYAMQDR